MRAEPGSLRAPQALPPDADQHGRRLCAARNLRVAAGIGPAPGAHALLPAWWGRDHWVNFEVPVAVKTHREWAREEHVDPDTAVRVARGMAAYADHGTGRHCRPTNEALAAQLGCSTRTVQRARRLLKRLRLVAEVVRGRSIMTRAERLRAWRRGSSHRRLAAEFALLSRRTTARLRPQGQPPPVERVTPPGDAVGKLDTSPKLGFFASGSRKDERRSAPHSRPRARSRPVSVAEVRSRRLIAGVQRRIGWLSRVSPRRLTSLHRFAAQGWTERDVHRALDEVLRARGWSVPDRIEQPAAYLAALLRDVDPADRPGAYDEQLLAEERARREWVWATTFGDELCEHGQPAGNLPHPLLGHVACPQCRRSALAVDVGDDRVHPRGADLRQAGDLADQHP